MCEVIEEVEIHFAVGCEVVVAFKIYFTPKNHENGIGRILQGRQLQNLLQIHMDCPRRYSLALQSIQQQIMFSEFRPSALISLFLGGKAGACSNVGDGEMCFSGVCEHVILFKLKIGQESVATHPADYSKGLNLTVPLRELNEFFQDGCYGEFFHQQADFEAGLAFVLQNATLFYVFDQFIGSIIEQFQFEDRSLQIGKILLFLKLHVFFLIKILFKDAFFPLKLKLCSQLAVIGYVSICLLQFFSELPALSDEVNDDAVDEGAGSFFLKAKLVLIPIICYPEDEAFLMGTVHLRHPQPFDGKLMPGLLILTLLPDGEAVGVAGDEAGGPSGKGLLAAEGGPLIVEVLDGLLACQALHDAHEEGDLRLPVHLLQ